MAEPMLGPALEAIGRITGSNVLYPYELAELRGMNEVSGHLTPGEALSILLRDTALSGQLTEGGVIVVTPLVPQSTESTEIPMENKNRASWGSLVAGLVVGLAGPESLAAQEEAQEEAEYLEQVVVTGVRGEPRSILSSPTPIDVFTAQDLERVPQIGLFESLRYLVPSINLPQRAGGGTATFIASAGLRGLNPDQTLILVNGKRRHKTALINTATGLYSGSAGVDLNMIPNSAIERIEVLRDGAAAQYGSDAIAGVINIILKDADSGGELTASGRENFDRGDGEIVTLGFNQGLELTENGFVNVSVDYRESEFSNRARPVPLPDEPGGRNIFPLLGDGSLDPREFTIDRLVTSNYGNFPQNVLSSAINAGYQLDDVELYGFATYAQRDSILDFTFRSPGDARNVPEIYPFGYRPREEIREDDYELVLGARSEILDFDVDVSASFGTNETDWYNTLGLNASLGVASPTSFYLGGIDAEETVLQLDATRRIDLGRSGVLQASFGGQFRNEGFEIREGEELSYVDGGNGAPPEAQGFPGFSPQAVNHVERDNLNGYVELGWEPNERTLLSVAGRYEDFSDDSGSEFIYKVSGRYDLTDRLAFRGSFNTGFRAPGIQQLGFRGSRGQFQDLDNDGVAETIVVRQTLPGTDPAAQALGAEPLVPETSTNFSLGLVYQPLDNVDITVDLYQIEVEDRIALSTQFNRGDNRPAAGGGTIGDEISALLDAAGFDASLGGANYFTNAIDTRTRGIDVVVTWALDGAWGSLNNSAAYNYNDDEVTSVDPNPPELSGLVLADGTPLQQFDRSRLSTYTRDIPPSKLVLSSVYTFRSLVANLRAVRFGEWDSVAAVPANDTSNDPAWIVDLEVGYEFPSGISIYGGANNLFNNYPDEVRPVNGIGNGFYDTTSPYGFTGGSYYLRGAYRW
ncbi:MAG: TonB-dependent receptor [Pseudomonadales bacterium]|nr:TonB-dependent receptor [Pseudomonadales bacterium]